MISSTVKNQKILIPDDALDLRNQKPPEENTEVKLSTDRTNRPLGYFGEREDSFRSKNDKWLGYSKFFIYVLIFLAPLFFLPLTAAPVEINKQFLGIILVLISFVCYLVNIILSKKIVYSSSPIFFAVLAVIISVGLSYFFSADKNISFYGNLIQPNGFISFISYGLAFFLISVLFTKEDFKKIGIVFLASFTLVNIIGILQMAGIFIFPLDFAKQINFNTIGSLFNYGVFIAFGLLLTIAALSELKFSWRAKAVLIAASLIVMLQLAALNYQFLWMPIVIVSLLLAAHKFIQPARILKEDNNAVLSGQKNQASMPLVFMIISLFFLLIGPSLPQILKVPIEIKPDLSSTLTVAKESMAGKNIILGSGPATFGYNYVLYRPLELNQTNFWGIKFNQGFSFFTTSLTTIGVLGILVFIFLILVFIFLVLKNLQNSHVLIIAFGIIFMFLELFLSEAFFIQFILIFLGLGLIVSFISPAKKISLEGKTKANSFAAFILAVCLITGSMALLYTTGQKYIAAVYYGKALASNDYPSLYDNLAKAIILDPDRDLYLRDLSQYYILDVKQRLSEEDKTLSKIDADKIIQNEIAYAVQAAQKATVINPSEFLNWSNLADIYEKIMQVLGGADLFAEKNYKEAMARDPKNPLLQLSAARVLIASTDIKKAQSTKDSDTSVEQKQKLDDARAYLDKSLELKPDYAPAHFQIAMIYIRQGKTKEAIEKLEETKQYAPFDSNLSFQLGALYYDDNQMDKAQAELERTVSLNDNYSDARYILGLIYDKNGKKGKAIDEFKKILALNENNEQIKKILKNLADDKDALYGLDSATEPAPQPLPTGLESESKVKENIPKQ